jgi:subtilisin family serine protease
MCSRRYFGAFVFFILIVAVGFSVLHAVPGFSQPAAAQAVERLKQSSKIISPDSVLKSFAEGGKTTNVIVLLRDQSSAGAQTATPFPQTHSGSSVRSLDSAARGDLATSAGRELMRNRIASTLNSFVGALDPTKVKVTGRFSYMLGFSAEVTLEALEELVNNDQVLSIEENSILKAHLAQGIPLMNATSTRSAHDGAGLSIAICDTGVDVSHPALGGTATFPNSKVIGGYDTGDHDADPRPDPLLGEAHGTACAGIAAGDLGSVGDYIGGVAPGAKLYAVKISTLNTGSATSASMIEGWEWCITHQNDNPSYPIMIISTSFGGGRSLSTCDADVPAMTTAAANAVAAGITIFSSSGNDGYCDSVAWPACISHVVSVGAVYDAAFGDYYPCVSADSCAVKYDAGGGCSTGWYSIDSSAADMVTSYSNSASFVTLLAPSNQAYTADIVGIGGYDSGDYDQTFGGTSAACPYAAGAAAVLQNAAKQLYGHYLTPSAVKSSLVNNGDLVTDGKNSIIKPRVNLGKAYAALQGVEVLWNQPVSTATADVYAAQDFETSNDAYDIFRADDFSNTEPWSIQSIFIPGDTWNPPCDLGCATTLNFMIYRDNGSGAPAGYPDGGLGGSGDAPLWSLSVSPSDARVALSNDIGGLPTQVSLTLTTPVQLSRGTYWLVFYPTMSFDACCQFGMHVSDTTNGNIAKVINPGGGFYSGSVTSWTNMTTADVITQHDLAFRLEGLKGKNVIVPYLLLLQ